MGHKTIAHQRDNQGTASRMSDACSEEQETPKPRETRVLGESRNEEGQATTQAKVQRTPNRRIPTFESPNLAHRKCVVIPS